MQQIIGSNVLRDNFDKDIWIKSLFGNYIPKESKWIITDVRYPNEVKAIKDKKGILIRINRPKLKNNDNHISEIALDHYDDFDYIIDNNSSLIKYEENIYTIINNIISERW